MLCRAESRHSAQVAWEKGQWCLLTPLPANLTVSSASPLSFLLYLPPPPSPQRLKQTFQREGKAG